jgi:hypothetical protein
MPTFGTITTNQMKRLQTLYGQLQAHSIESSGREARLSWATEQLGRPITSFKAISFSEAKGLIDGLQGQLGVKEPPRRRHGRAQARRAGLDGRKGQTEFANAPQAVDARDLAAIEEYYLRLGWTRAQFDGWLQSPHSPIGARANKQILTTADANRVRWALKGMLQQRGLWEVRSAR